MKQRVVKKRILSVILAMAVMAGMLSGVLPLHTAATAEEPSVAVYINGQWCVAQSLAGKSGVCWLSLPIPGSLLGNSRDNYVRVTSNVANGTEENQQLKLYLTGSTWSNTFLSTQIWVDDNWTGYTDRQANIYIEGWDGSQWKRIHDDIDTGYKTDYESPLGKDSAGGYANFARNIWVGDNVVENYTAFRVKMQVFVGGDLAVNPDNAALFPAGNYLSCDLCDVCGGCKSASCTLGHQSCTATANGHHCPYCQGKCNCTDSDCHCGEGLCHNDEAIRVRVNGSWYGLSVKDLLDTDKQWVSVPISMKDLTENTQYQVAVSSNIQSGGNLTADSIDLYATNAADGLESYFTNHQYCDENWQPYTDRNINVKLEGWNGHEWVDLSAAKPTYSTDQSTVLGLYRENSTWYNACRNITLGSLSQITAMRVSVQLHIGKDVKAATDYQADTFATFLPEPVVEPHAMCPQHPDSCLTEGCPYHTCGDLHHCVFCPECGKCADKACGCDHEKCEISENAAIRVRVNDTWYGLYIAGATDSEDALWQYVPIDITKLNQNTTNYLNLSSNLVNTGDHTRHSVDVYFSGEGDGSSFYTADPYCDGGWSGYADRRINMMLQFYDGTQWVSAVEETYSMEHHSVIGQFTGDGNWYNYARNLDLGDLTGYSAARVAIQLHIGQGSVSAEDYVEEQFANFLHTDLAGEPPVSQEGDVVVVHRTQPDEPGAGEAGAGGTAKLQLRVNGVWYEADLTDIPLGRYGEAWVALDFPASALKGNAENQLLLTSNVKNGGAYSENSLDLFATRVPEGQSFRNANNYYDDWYLYSNYQWNLKLLASADGQQWTALTGTSPAYYDAAIPMGQNSDGSGSYAARNVNLGDVSGFSHARLLVQVHIGGKLTTTDAGDTPDEPDKPVAHITEPWPVGPAVENGNTGGTPMLRVRANGVWYETSLAPALGKNGTWLYVPVENLNGNMENYFSFSTNVTNHGSMNGNTVELYAGTTAAGSSFTTPDQWCDNDFALWDGYDFNVRVEGYDGKQWVLLAGNDKAFYDGVSMLGYRADTDRWYNCARNLVLGDLSGYTRFRVGVLLHVGDRLDVKAAPQAQPVPHKSTVPTETPGESVTDSADTVLKVRVNGTWFTVNLQEYKGKGSVWVPVPVDIGELRAGEENYFSVSSNVANHGHLSGSSVDIYYTNAREGLNSLFTGDEYCDDGFAFYSDRNINLHVELFDGQKWVTVAPQETTYYDGSIALGYDAEGQDWSNVARNLILGSLDGYTQARVSVQLHVGGTLALHGEAPGAGDADDPSNSGDTTPPSENVTLPTHPEEEPVPEASETQPSQATQEPGSGLWWIWLVVIGLLLLLTALVFLLKKKKRG